MKKEKVKEIIINKEYPESVVELLNKHEQKFAVQEERITALAQQLEGAAAVIASMQEQLRRREDRQLRRDPWLCRHFMAGRCFYGSQCRFSHNMASTTAPRRSPAPRPPPSPASRPPLTPPPSARTARSTAAASSQTGKCSAMQKFQQSSVPCCIPTPRSVGTAFDVTPDLEVVDDNEKAANALRDAKKNNYRLGEDKFISGLVNFIDEYKRKECVASARADDLWILVTRRRPRASSARRTRSSSWRERGDAGR